MPLSIIAGDLSRFQADVLVNSAHPSPIIGTGVEKALYDKAGPALLNAREAYGPLSLGVLFKSEAYGLDATYIYHVLTPDYQAPSAGEQLAKLYDQCLFKALEDQVDSIAFPLLGSGNHVFPKAKALAIAHAQIAKFLSTYDLDVYLVVYDLNAFVLPETYPTFEPVQMPDMQGILYNKMAFDPGAWAESEGFQPMLFELIDARELDDVTVYKKANISRKVFSKIRSNEDYHPSKKTAIALAIGLELSLDETLDLMGKAGYTLSESILFDRIITYFITHQEYDIFTINETLFYYDQSTL